MFYSFRQRAKSLVMATGQGRRLALVWVGFVCCFISQVGLAQADSIAVGLASGRIFVGDIDPRTSRSHLWIRAERDGAAVVRPIDWNAIHSATDGRTMYSADELRSLAVGDASSASHAAEAREPVAEAQASVSTTEVLPPPSGWQPDARRAKAIAKAGAANRKAVSISIEACVANWNQTVEADGILLRLIPLDDRGCATPVQGTLTVELIASAPPGWPAGRPFPHIGRWSVAVVPQQFGPLGATFKLPFQARHPEFDTRLEPVGLVHARLSVPGNASLEASQSMVRIRPYSEVRDRLQQATGQRFFDVERATRWGPR